MCAEYVTSVARLKTLIKETKCQSDANGILIIVLYRTTDWFRLTEIGFNR